jgi:hypothetical protein
VLRDALTAALVCGVAAVVAAVLLIVVRGPGSLHDAVAYAPAAALGDALLAMLLVPLVRWMLRSEALRAPHPGFPELALGGPPRG